MRTNISDKEWLQHRASHDPIDDLPAFRHVLITLGVLALVGIHWVPVTAYLDGADPATVGMAVLEMWGLAVVVVVGGCILVAVLLTLAYGIGLGLAAIAAVMPGVPEAPGDGRGEVLPMWPEGDDDRHDRINV